MHLHEGGRGATATQDESEGESDTACSAESLALIKNNVTQHVASFLPISRTSADRAKEKHSVHTLALSNDFKQGDL